MAETFIAELQNFDRQPLGHFDVAYTHGTRLPPVIVHWHGMHFDLTDAVTSIEHNGRTRQAHVYRRLTSAVIPLDQDPLKLDAGVS